jgi:hypothetical protein
MIGYINLEERVDGDFRLARRKALLGWIGDRLRTRGAASNRLLCFDEVRKISGAVGRVYRGTRTVQVGQVRGSVGRCSEFDGGFMPVKASVEGRWKHIDRAFHRGEALPPVSLYKLGGSYFVLDGHHRVSVARYHRVEWIDAEVTEFSAWLPEGRRGGCYAEPRDKRIRANEMAYSQEVVRQHREEIAREIKQYRRARELGRFRRRRVGVSDRALDFTWELKRIAGRLFKIYRALSDTD